jgi:hypothetical protein
MHLQAGNGCAALMLAIATCALPVGCTLGPRQIDADRIAYNRSIQQTQQEEMLLNLVRLKYREPLEFMSVGAVAAQYTWDGSASVNGSLLEAGPNILGISGGVGRVESPTISYVPQENADFNRALLSPLSIETLVLVTRTGWAFDRVLRCAVQNINGLDNATSAGGPTPSRKPDFETFRYLAQNLRVLQLQHGVEMAQSEREVMQTTPVQLETISETAALNALDQGYRFKRDEKGCWQLYQREQFPSMTLSPAALATHEGQEVIQLLMLQPGRTTYELELAKGGQIQAALGGPQESSIPVRLPAPDGYGSRQKVTLSTRSLVEIMFFLSQGIQIPEEHLRQGMVTVTVDESGAPFDWGEVTGDLLQVCVSRQRPKCAAVAVTFRGYWYSIHRSDLDSLSTFLFLMQLFNIEAEAGGGRGLPVLTLGI